MNKALILLLFLTGCATMETVRVDRVVKGDHSFEYTLVTEDNEVIRATSMVLEDTIGAVWEIERTEEGRLIERAGNRNGTKSPLVIGVHFKRK